MLPTAIHKCQRVAAAIEKGIIVDEVELGAVIAKGPATLVCRHGIYKNDGINHYIRVLKLWLINRCLCILEGKLLIITSGARFHKDPF